ncbi:Uncharacterised protein [Yersinia enterocolitica]|nr:Uncharacterised protein [Yersinia enterocolitica]
MHLMSNKAINGVGNRDTVDQQNWVDSEEVKQGNQFTRALTKMLFNHFSDIFSRIFT